MPEGLIQNPSTPQLDPDLLNAAYSPSVRKTVRGGDKLTGVKPELVEHWNNLQSEFSKAGIAPEIRSGYRTAAQQQALYNNPATRARTKGNDGIVKISPHQRGEALDISFPAAQRAKGRQIIANYARQNGLQIPSDEPWHVGLRMQKPKPSPSLDPDLMEAGYGQQSAAPETPETPAAQAAPSLDPDLLKAAYGEEPAVTGETSQAAVGLTPGMGAARLMRQRPQQSKQKPARATSAVSMIPGMGAVRQMRQPRPQPSIADLKRADEQVVDQMFNPERQGVATNFPETKVDPRVLKGEQPSDPMAYAKAQELVGRVDPARSSNPTQEQNEREALERDPAMIAARKRIGSIPAQGRLPGASPRGVASAFQRFGGETVKAVGSAFELPERVLGGLAKQVGLPAPKVQEALNRYGNILSESASMPLNAQGEAIVRSLPEKATDQVTSLGLSLAELIALKRASGLNLGPLMAITSFAKNSDKPIGQRSAIATEAGLMGKVLDQHLSRPMSAVVFGAPTAVESGLQYAQGNKSLEDALLETGIQATAGAVLGGKQKAERPELGRANEPITETRPEVPRVSEPIPQAQEAQVTSEVGAVRPSEVQAAIADSIARKNARVAEGEQVERRGPDRLSDEEYQAAIADSLRRKNERVAAEQISQPATETNTTPQPATEIPASKPVEPPQVAAQPVVAKTETTAPTSVSTIPESAVETELDALRTQSGEKLLTAPEGKTKLDLILDGVESKKGEVTFDVRDYTAEQAQRIIDTAKARGLDTASDGKFILVRDLRESGAAPKPEGAPTEVAPKTVESQIQDRIKAEIPDHAPKFVKQQKEFLIRRELEGATDEPSGRQTGGVKLPDEDFARLVSRGWDLYDQKIKPTFEEWAQKIKAEFGKVDEHLKDVWARINGDEGEVKGVTSIKNAAVETSREVRGLPELAPADHRSWEAAGEQAREQGLDTPDKADAIAKQVLDGTKKQLTDVESAGLRDRLRGIENDYEKLAQATDTAFHPDELADLKVQADLLREKHQVLTDATKKAGTEIARALAIRRSAVDQDMLLTQLGAERSYKVTTGKEPSPEVQKQIKDLVAENTRLKAEVEKHEAVRQEKAKAKDLEKVIIEKKIEIRRAGRHRAREVLVQERADIKQRIAAAWKKVGSPNITGASAIDPEGELSRALGDLARNYIEDGVIKAEDIVDAIHEQIKDVADLTKRQVSDLISGYGKTRESTHDPVEQKLNEVKSILAATSGKADVLEQGIRPLRRGQQREKPTEDQRRALRELEDAMRQKGPELAQEPYDVKTEQATPLDKAKTTARNRQEQLKSWIATGKREVQGRQQIIPDAELRQLKAENAALERVVAQLNDPAADQKAIDRRIALLNKILVDARAKIQSGEVAPQVKEGAKQPWSPEISEMMKERAALSRIAGDMRADAARKAKAVELAKPTGLYGVEGSWADFEARAKKVLASRARLEKQIGEYQRRIKQKDFSTKQRAEPIYDAEGNRLRAKLQNVQRDFQRLKDAERKTTVADAFIRWKRFSVLSYLSTLGKLTTAASARMAATPLYETAGQVGKRLMPKTFADEPSFKAFLKGEKAAVMQLWQADSFRDFISHLKGGEDLIELLYGKEGGDEFVKSSGGKTLIPRTVGEVLDRPGHLHAALKTVPKRAGFFRAFERGLQKEIEKPNPRDIRDPTVQLAIAGEAKAYEESKRAILQQKNWVTTLFNQAVGSLNRSDARGAKFLGKLLQFRYPITKVPVNYVGETAMHIAGLPAGLGEVAIRGASGPLKARMIASRRQVIKDLAERMPKAMDDLEPEQRQRIARAIKVGGVGLGFVVWGAMRPDQFGGYYQPGKRDQKDVKFGGMRFLGINFPQWMGHIPPMEAAQFGATLRRVYDSMQKKGKEDVAVQEGVKEATKGLAEEIPFNQDSLLDVMLGSESKGRKLLGGEIRSVVPGFVQQGAKASDYPAGTTLTERLNPFGSKEPIPRKPETIKQEVKMGIPGLRQQVPVDENRLRAPVVESFQERFMKGVITPADLNRARKNSELTQSEVNSMLEEKDLSKEFNPKQLQFYKSPVLTQNKTSPTLDRFERMSPAQREEVKKIMQDKADSIMYSDALTDLQKKAFAERLKKVGLLVRGGPK